ncbi:MAG TPA: septal ring lytic transglycosylase RlpA family protein [Patescibacteria group bacterium]|nr:septal ring lytic transglycosylase RlpA family protein [Patescibacteria group bacterium]
MKKKIRAIVCATVILLGFLFIASSSDAFGKTKPKSSAQTQPSVQKANPAAKKKEEAKTEVGVAKYYDGAPKGKKRELTAAHKSLPKGTIVRVESLESGDFKTIEVEINDCLPDTPASRGTVIDLAKQSAIAMNPAFIRKGVLKVKLTVIEQP